MPLGSQRPARTVSPLNAIMWILMLIFSIYVLFFIAKGIFSLLLYASPLLLIASFVLDKTVIINYIKFLFNKLKTDTLVGVGAVALSAFAFPVLCGYLFLKALIKNKIGKKFQEFEQKEQGEFADFEVVDDDFLTLPELEKPTVRSSSSQQKNTESNDYEDLFK